MPRGATSIEFYGACSFSEGSEPGPCGHPFAIAFGQKTEAILEAHGIKGGICAALLVKRLGQAGHPKVNEPLRIGGQHGEALPDIDRVPTLGVGAPTSGEVRA